MTDLNVVELEGKENSELFKRTMNMVKKSPKFFTVFWNPDINNWSTLRWNITSQDMIYTCEIFKAQAVSFELEDFGKGEW